MADMGWLLRARSLAEADWAGGWRVEWQTACNDALCQRTKTDWDARAVETRIQIAINVQLKRMLCHAAIVLGLNVMGIAAL